MASAESVWDSEGVAAERVTADGEGGLAPGGAVGSPQTPTHLRQQPGLVRCCIGLDCEHFSSPNT
jgi:hypothetical protein